MRASNHQSAHNWLGVLAIIALALLAAIFKPKSKRGHR